MQLDLSAAHVVGHLTDFKALLHFQVATKPLSI